MKIRNRTGEEQTFKECYAMFEVKNVADICFKILQSEVNFLT